MAVLQHLFVRATTEELVLQFASIASKLQKSSENEVDPELSRAKEAIASHALFDLTQDYAKLAANLLLIPETQLESHFTLLLALIFKVTEKEKEDTQQTLLLQHVLKSLLNSTYEKGSMKLRLVLLIFNILPPTSPLRAHAFEVLSELAHRHGEMKALGTQLGSLRTWLQEWALPLSEVLRFMKRLSQMFMTAHLSKEAYDTLLLLLPLCQDSKDDFEWVFHQSVYVGLSSSTDVLDLSGLLPFSSWLPHSSPAMWLVHTYVTGNVQAFHTTASPLVASLCEKLKVPMLNFALATDHVRCMHLSRIPSGLTLTYTDLSQVLVCDLDRVERYLLDASHFHGIKAKLNPIDQTVLFLQPHASHFQAEDWDHLTHSLVSWKSKFEKIQTKVLNIGQEDFHLADDSENEEDDEEEKEDGEEQEEEEEEREEQEQEDEEAEEEEVYVESPTEQRVLKNDKKTKEGEENELEETLERIKFE